MTEDSSPILLIFDVDGTIGNTGGVGKTAFELTFCELYSIPRSAEGIKPFGKTDQIIFEELLQNNKIKYQDFKVEFDRFSVQYIANFDILIADSILPFLYEGVVDLLTMIEETEWLYLALGTGNLKETAYLHLQKYNLERYFPTGGFSNFAKDRSKLINQAFDNAVLHYNINFDYRQTWVIGDTPNDIIAGKDNNFQTLAVATGPFSIDELSEYKPNAIMRDLTMLNCLCQ